MLDHSLLVRSKDWHDVVTARSSLRGSLEDFSDAAHYCQMGQGHSSLDLQRSFNSGVELRIRDGLRVSPRKGEQSFQASFTNLASHTQLHEKSRNM